MVYIFGTRNKQETLKTKGNSHTNLSGFHQIERTYSEETITDYFRIVRKIESKEDSSGNCYDWYEIDCHYRTIDKTGPIIKQAEQIRADVDYISIMTGVKLV